MPLALATFAQRAEALAGLPDTTAANSLVRDLTTVLRAVVVVGSSVLHSGGRRSVSPFPMAAERMRETALVTVVSLNRR